MPFFIPPPPNYLVLGLVLCQPHLTPPPVTGIIIIGYLFEFDFQIDQFESEIESFQSGNKKKKVDREVAIIFLIFYLLEIQTLRSLLFHKYLRKTLLATE